LENLDLLAFLEHQGLKETWVQLVRKEVQDSRVLEVKREKPEDQENLVRWDLLERMDLMEKRVVQDHQEVLVLQGSQVQGVSQA